jgi:hypothetical protein
LRNLEPIPALFQTGYLTVDKNSVDQSLSTIYSLKIPNREIQKISFSIFSDALFNKLLDRSKLADFDSVEKAIETRDGQKLTQIVSFLYSALPPVHHHKVESFYHSLLIAYLEKI